MPSSSLDQTMSGIGIGLSDMFVNMSAEYPQFLDAILIIFAAAGVFIASTAVFDVIKMGDKTAGEKQGGFGSIFAKMIGGSLMIDLAFWASVMGDSFWSHSNPLGIESYTATNGADDMAQTALMAVIGFIVLTGYVVLGRAYFMVTKLGYLSPEARSDLIGSIISRVFAGTAMIACLHVARGIEASTGINWLPN